MTNDDERTSLSIAPMHLEHRDEDDLRYFQSMILLL